MADTLKSNLDKSNGTTAVDLCTVPNVSTTYNTILSVSICNTSATDFTFDLYLKDVSNRSSAGANTLFYVYQDQSLPGKSTFIHNDKIMMQAQDILQIAMSASTADIEIITSFLEQTA